MADQMSKEYDAVKELGLCVLHVGINANGEEDALRIADEFQTLMGFIPRVGNSSIFASDLIEIMKKANFRFHKRKAAAVRHPFVLQGLYNQWNFLKLWQEYLS